MKKQLVSKIVFTLLALVIAFQSGRLRQSAACHEPLQLRSWIQLNTQATSVPPQTSGSTAPASDSSSCHARRWDAGWHGRHHDITHANL